MENIDWSSFVKRISIKSSPSDIFSYFVTQDKLERWFLSTAEFYSSGELKSRNDQISEGDTYIWKWHGSDNVAEGEILELGKEYLRMTFLGCIVEIKMKVEQNENVLEISQSEIALDEESRLSYYVGCTRGWTFYMTNLKSIMEGGIDLRNRNGGLVNVINT